MGRGQGSADAYDRDEAVKIYMILSSSCTYMESAELYSLLRTIKGDHTFHGLFNSNPGGASGLSVCPRR